MSKIVFKYSYHFVFFLVLYEFSVYISNDMIMPAMIFVIQDFKVNENYIPSALSLYIFGGSCLQLFVGAFAEIYGKKKLLLCGIMFFIIGTAINGLALNIEQFLCARVIQGMGIAFISAIGYATIQETFAEKEAVKIISIMTSLSILAPLFGPIFGSIFLDFFHWRYINLIIMILAFISFIGLFFTFPHDKKETVHKNLFTHASKTYFKIIKRKNYLYGVLAFTFAQLPLILWISISPILLITNAKLPLIEYGLLQFPVFGGFIIGVVLLQFLLKKYELHKIIKISALILTLGLSSSFFFSLLYPNSYLGIVYSLAFYAVGLGALSSPLFRLVLFISSDAKTSMTALFSFINMIILSFGIEILSSYIKNILIFSAALFIFQLIFLINLKLFIKTLNNFKQQ